MNRKLIAFTLGLSGLGASALSAETVHLYVRSGKPPATAAKLQLQMSTQAENRIVQAAREASSGQATGKRQHKPIRLRVPSNNAAFNALCNNENISEWQLQFVRPNPAGKTQCYQTITFTGVNAKITPSTGGRRASSQEYEEILIVFHTIKLDERKQEWSDDWLAPLLAGLLAH